MSSMRSLPQHRYDEMWVADRVYHSRFTDGNRNGLMKCAATIHIINKKKNKSPSRTLEVNNLCGIEQAGKRCCVRQTGGDDQAVVIYTFGVQGKPSLPWGE